VNGLRATDDEPADDELERLRNKKAAMFELKLEIGHKQSGILRKIQSLEENLLLGLEIAHAQHKNAFTGPNSFELGLMLAEEENDVKKKIQFLGRFNGI
jgi:hypothetical protein